MALNFEELLKQIHDGNSEFLIKDSEPVITINTIKRTLDLPSGFITQIGITNDYNSNAIRFETDVLVEGHDVSKCASVAIKWHNVAANAYGVFEVPQNKRIVSNDKMQFEWIIPPEALTKAGKLRVAISFSDYNNEGKSHKNLIYKWNSQVCESLTVTQGLDTVGEEGMPFAQILQLDMRTRNIIIPADFNTTIANAGDCGVITIPIRVGRFYNNIDFENATLRLLLQNANKEAIVQTLVDKHIIESLDGNIKDDWIEYSWEVPAKITEAPGSIALAIQIRFEEPELSRDGNTVYDFIWNSNVCTSLKIGQSFLTPTIQPYDAEEGYPFVPENGLLELLKAEFDYTA